MSVLQSKSKGGARINSGKRMPSGAKAVRKQISIDPEDELLFLAFGQGLSVGIRLAAQLVRDVASSEVKDGVFLVRQGALPSHADT